MADFVQILADLRDRAETAGPSQQNAKQHILYYDMLIGIYNLHI